MPQVLARHLAPHRRLVLFLCLALLTASAAMARGEKSRGEAKAKKPLTFVDLMQFHTIVKPVLSDDGSTVAYQSKPDRGDGAVVVVRGDGSGERKIELGAEPALSPDGRWAMAKVVPSLEASENAEDEKLEDGLALLEVGNGELRTWERVKRAAFSMDGGYLAILQTEKAREEAEAEAEEGNEAEAQVATASGAEPESEISAESEAEAESPQGEGEEEGVGEEEAGDEEGAEEEEKDEHLGTTLTLIDLESGAETVVEYVSSFAFAEASSHLAYAVAAPEGENGLFVRRPSGSEPLSVVRAKRGRYSALTWAKDEALLAFVAAIDDEEGEAGDGEVWIWQGASGEGRAVATTDTTSDGSFIPSTNKLAWSRDGQRLFYGTKPRSEVEDKPEEDEAFDPYDVEALLSEKGVDVWHVKDPLIKTNEREQWDEDEKDRTFLAVYHRAAGDGASNIQLAGPEVRQVSPAHNPRGVLGVADVPYLRERTWEGFFGDLYWISLEDGARHLIAEHLSTGNIEASEALSPDGRFAVWYRQPHWYLFDAEDGSSRNLTANLDVPFDDEDHDYPREAGGYGVGAWLSDSSAVLIHDKYDVWSFPTDGAAEARNLTRIGRQEQLKLRVVDEGLDQDDKVHILDPDKRILLHGEREGEKNHGFWQLGSVEGELEKLVESANRFRFRARAKDSDEILFTRESYREFPDLRLTRPDFAADRKLSNVNPQVADFAWGNAELISFTDADGGAADAILIRPETLQEGERCPVLVYYYRFFSQRLYSFNEPKVNHRPSFPVYASHGYCVFLPDIRFEIGRPGFSATKALVPAVQKIVDMGVADPERIGLHGHSWSGYQTAFVITQTNIFAAAVAGAPVSNMTSAYGGIRYGSGLARQFQYEAGQSRIGHSLWENRDLYIENSPLFYADRIQTPLLIQFGDADEAVPWTQGVELYLALRRLDKEAVFLQYHGEPHHLKKYPNKLDYSIKMKEFFDHYLKDAPAPVWLRDGVPYRGDDAE